MQSLATLLQITDSAFPIGSYAMSSGLESLVRNGSIRKDDDLREFIDVHVAESLAATDLPLVRFSTGAATPATLIEIDARADAIKPVATYREASIRLGRRFADAFLSIRPDASSITVLRAWITCGSTPGHHAVIFGAACRDLAIDAGMAATAFGYSAVQGYAAAAVRLGVIGQSRAQRLTAEAVASIDRHVKETDIQSLDDLGGYLPMIDIAGIQHRTLHGRLFAS